MEFALGLLKLTYKVLQPKTKKMYQLTSGLLGLVTFLFLKNVSY